MNLPLPVLLLPLLSALLYSLAITLLKRVLGSTGDLWGMACVINGVVALVYAPMFFFGEPSIPWERAYQPALVGLFFLLGQVLSFKAIAQGDLSVATPALGLKILIVAVLSVFFLNDPIAWTWWLAAFLAVAALVLLGIGQPMQRRNTAVTLLLSLAAAFQFACTDILVQKWAPDWGAPRFLAFFAVAGFVYSLLFFAMADKSRHRYSAADKKMVFWGALLFAFQAMGLGLALGYYGMATVVNIVYSSRGVWNILLVLAIGAQLGNAEFAGGGRILAFRLVGAALITAAIALVSL